MHPEPSDSRMRSRGRVAVVTAWVSYSPSRARGPQFQDPKKGCFLPAASIHASEAGWRAGGTHVCPRCGLRCHSCHPAWLCTPVSSLGKEGRTYVTSTLVFVLHIGGY